MKTIIASAALLLCATASARNLKITVSDLRSDKGRILWYIHGDARPRQGMEKPESGSVAVSAEDFTADSVTLYLFHDENGNYRLDRRDDGKPAEGCCTRAIVLSAEKNEIRVRLRYEFPEEPAGEAAETPARAKLPAATAPAGTPDELDRGSEYIHTFATERHTNMEEKRLDAAESLALIGRMIENTRNDMERNAGRPFLVWGYVTLLTTLLVWGTVVQTGEPRWNLLWLLIPLLGGTLTYFTRGKRTEGRVHTFVDRVLGSVWLVAGLTASFLSLVALFTPIRLPILFVILLTMGMGTAATGLILRFRPAACCGAAAILLAPGMLIVHNDWQPALFAAGFLAMMIVPGHILTYRSNHPKK